MTYFKVFPDKVMNTRIVRNGLIRTIQIMIAGGDWFDWQIINEGVAVVRYLVLKKKRHISLINLYHICVFFRDHCQMMMMERNVESGEGS